MASQPVNPEQPPISRLPSNDRALDRFLEQDVRPWSGEPAGLPTGVTVLLWGVGVSDAAFAVWLTLVRSGVLRMSAWPVDVATLGGHSDGLLVLAAANAVIVAALALPTRGLSRASAVPLGLLVAGCVGGSIALLGIAVLLLITAVVVGALVGVLAFAATRL